MLRSISRLVSRADNSSEQQRESRAEFPAGTPTRGRFFGDLDSKPPRPGQYRRITHFESAFLIRLIPSLVTRV